MNYDLIEVNACPLCNSTEYTIVFTQNRFSGKQCDECDLVYMSPRVKNIDAVYTDDITSSTSEYYTLSVAADKKTFQKRLKLIEQYIRKGSFLDIGSGTGDRKSVV